MQYSAKDLGLPTGDAYIVNGETVVYETGQSPSQAAIEPTRMDITPTSPAQTVVNVKTSAEDRAIGFDISTRRLSRAFALFLVAGSFGYMWWQSMPLWGWVPFGVYLVCGLIAYSLTWLVAWIVHNLISSEMAIILNSIFGFIIVYREQSFRHRGRG